MYIVNVYCKLSGNSRLKENTVRGLELTSSHRHTKMTAIYRETIDKNNQKMGRKGIKDLLQLKI